MPELTNLDRVNDHARDAIRDYASRLLELHGDNLISLAVYGSAARGDFSPKRSDINLALVVRKLDVETLSRTLKLAARGLRRRIVPPLFLTREYISSSLDVFPLEFQEMRDCHVNIFGDDVLADIEIKPSDLRLECEQQVKGKMLRLRQAYLELGRSTKGIELLLHQSLNSLVPVLRGLLTLKGQKPSTSKDEVITAAAKEFGIDSSPFLAVFRDKLGDEKISGQEAPHVLELFLQQIARLAKQVDTL